MKRRSHRTAQNKLSLNKGRILRRSGKITSPNNKKMKSSDANNERPYQEIDLEGLEGKILEAQGMGMNEELSRRHFMDILATAGAGLSLTSLLSSL